MSLLDILISASQNMLRSKLRSILTIIAIFIGTFTISLTIGISQGISSYIDSQVGNLGAEDVLVVQPKIDFNLNQSSGPEEFNPERKVAVAGQFSSSQPVLTAADLQKISDIEGIKNVEPYNALAPSYIQLADSKKYEISMVTYVSGTNLDVEAGRLPNNFSKDNEIIIPLVYVEAFGFSESQELIGKDVKIGIVSAFGVSKEITATVVGVQQQTLVNSDGANANTSLSNEIYEVQSEGLPDSAKDQIFVALATFDAGYSEVEIDSLKQKLDEAGYSAQTFKDQIGAFKDVVNSVSYILVLFGAIALLAASFGIINTLFMAVQERTKEIGLMKALGMSSGKIFTLFSVEAILLGFWGSLLGISAAAAVGKLILNQFASATFLKDLQGFDLASFPAVLMTVVMVVIILIAFLAGALPARRAAKKDPIKALRYE